MGRGTCPSREAASDHVTPSGAEPLSKKTNSMSTIHPATYQRAIVECIAAAPSRSATLPHIYKMVEAAIQIPRRKNYNWQKEVRDALQALKRTGMIRHVGDGHWGLGDVDWRAFTADVLVPTTKAPDPWQRLYDVIMQDPEEESHTAQQDVRPPKGDTCPDDQLAIPLDQVRMSTRLRRRLQDYGVSCVAEVLEVDEETFGEIDGVGMTTVRYLRRLQSEIRDGFVREISDQPMPDAAIDVGQAKDASLATPIRNLKISTRLRNRLYEYGCATVADLNKVDPELFAASRNVGQRTLTELSELCDWVQKNVAAADGFAAKWTDSGSQLQPENREAAESNTEQPNAPLPQRTNDLTSAPSEKILFSCLGDVFSDLAARGGRSHSGANRRRNTTIWLEYHAAVGGRPKTLRRLAHEWRLSVGRIQQIVSRINELCRHLFSSRKAYTPVKEAARHAFSNCLGAVCLNELPVMMRECAGWEEPPSHDQLLLLAALLEGSPEAFFYDAEKTLYLHSQRCLQLWEALEARLPDALQRVDGQQHLMDFGYELGQQVECCVCPQRDCASSIIPCCGARESQVRLPKEYLKALLTTIDPCPLNGSDVFHPDWSVLKFERVKWRVMEAALRIIGRPIHYSELAEFVRTHNKRWRRAEDNNFLSSLIGNDKFVITEGRGIYALCEWDVDAYRTVADRVAELLESEGRPVPVWKVVDVMVSHGATEANVRACFSQQRFRCNPDGTLSLSEWRDDIEDSPGARPTPGCLFVDDHDDHFIIG